jgi:hypothetical protein
MLTKTGDFCKNGNVGMIFTKTISHRENVKMHSSLNPRRLLYLLTVDPQLSPTGRYIKR